jgi:hypothetical protein
MLDFSPRASQCPLGRLEEVPRACNAPPLPVPLGLRGIPLSGIFKNYKEPPPLHLFYQARKIIDCGTQKSPGKKIKKIQHRKKFTPRAYMHIPDFLIPGRNFHCGERHEISRENRKL